MIKTIHISSERKGIADSRPLPEKPESGEKEDPFDLNLSGEAAPLTRGGATPPSGEEIKKLIKELKSHDSNRVLDAIFRLGRWRVKKAREGLEKIVKGKSEDLRNLAAAALVRIGENEYLNVLVDAFKRARGKLVNYDDCQRSSVINALAWTDSQKAQYFLFEEMKSEAGPGLRLVLADILLNSPYEKDALATLTDILSDSEASPRMRQHAMHSASRTKSNEFLNSLIAVLNQRGPAQNECILNSYTALAKVDSLEICRLRRDAVAYLSYFPTDTRVVSLLLKMLEDPSRDVLETMNAIRVLVKLRAAEAIEPLRGLLNHPDGELRHMASLAINRLMQYQK